MHGRHLAWATSGWGVLQVAPRSGGVAPKWELYPLESGGRDLVRTQPETTDRAARLYPLTALANHIRL